MKVVLLALICYLIGCINPAYIIGKIKGFDIRSKGSMNAGASNVVINVGKRAGVATALFDILKAFFCVLKVILLLHLNFGFRAFQKILQFLDLFFWLTLLFY